jgi:hypothetical protein
MRLDPVFVLAPEPPRASRRAVLLGAGAFALGACAGAVVWPWLMGSADGDAAASERASADGEWARALAVGPPAALFEHATRFLVELGRTPDDAVLWQGALALARHVVAQERSDRTARVADMLLALARRIPRTGGVDFAGIVPALEGVQRR